MMIHVPLRLPSLANTRLHWRAMARIKKSQKTAVAVAIFGRALPPLPVVVTLTRLGPRRLDDDNLASAFKTVRDQIATTYGVDDGSTKYVWRYEQRIGANAIEITICTID